MNKLLTRLKNQFKKYQEKLGPKKIKNIKISAIIISVLFISLSLSYGWYSYIYRNTIYPNIMIGNIDFSGQTKSQAQQTIKDAIEKQQDKKLTFNLDKQTIQINSSEIQLKYVLDDTINKLYDYARNGNFWENFNSRIGLLFGKKNIYSVYDYDRLSLNNFLSDIFNQKEIPVANASFVFENDQIQINPEQSGLEINKSKLYSQIQEQLSSFDLETVINIDLVKVEPTIVSSELEQLLVKTQRAIADNIQVQSEVKDIQIDKNTIFKWLELVNKNETQLVSGWFSKAKAQTDKNIDIEVNQEKIILFIKSNSEDINKTAKDAKLTFEEGKVSVFQSPEKGYEVDATETAKKVAQLIYARMNVAGVNTQNDQDKTVNNLVEMSLNITDPDVSDKNIDELGIKELISSGATDFSGSPSNRIHNIKHGAELFDGVIIKPGETLSAISVIGNPSAETGYLAELVIKGNETIPEYGGGLCQVSTTLFRAALNAGLEILERTSHSYRVSYYEPPVGMDATVYYPKPDLVIKNNTPAHILIQTSVVGNKITFYMYGTKDNRQVDISNPELYDQINPPEPKYIDTEDLAEGETKRLESAHAGVKAQFSYKVVIDGQTVIDTIFRSNYVAWQAVYLRGTKKTEESSQEEQNNEESSDPEPTPESTPTPTPTTTTP